MNEYLTDDITMLSMELCERWEPMNEQKLPPTLEAIGMATTFVEQELATYGVLGKMAM